MNDKAYYHYLVDPAGEITLTIPFEGLQEGMQFKISDPQWKPGSMIRISPEEMDNLVGYFLEYTRTGIAPNIASERAKPTN